MARKKEKHVRHLAALLAVSIVMPQSVPAVHAFAEELHGQEGWKATPSEAGVLETEAGQTDSSGMFPEADRILKAACMGNQDEYDLELVVLEVKGKEWDGTDEVSCKIGLTGVRAGNEKVSLKSYTIRFDNPEVGEGKTVIVENVVLDGEDASHYRLASGTLYLCFPRTDHQKKIVSFRNGI